MELQKATGYLKNAYYQGHGRYVNQISRITIKFCKSSGGSRELRKFIETKLVDLARENPGCCIYVKPRLFKTPAISADYVNGETHYMSFHKMGALHIEGWIRWFLTRSGYQLNKLHRSTSTYRPSVQGVWTPFTFRDPATNLVKFPNEELGKYNRQLSATEIVARMPTVKQQ